MGERARARGFGFLGAVLSVAGAALDVSTTLYALKRVPGTREANVLSAKVQVALMLANPWTTLLWALLHALTPLLLFFAADALYPRLSGEGGPPHLPGSGGLRGGRVVRRRQQPRDRAGEVRSARGKQGRG